TREATLALARKAVDLGQQNQDLPWFRMALGMAEYRGGHYPEAIQALTAAAAGKDDNDEISGTAALYRAMSLFRHGEAAEARALFTATEARIKPFPARAKAIKSGDNHDELILWLACKEARALLQPPEATSIQPQP